MTFTNTELTAPATEPTTLALLKKHCAVDHADDDDLLTKQLKAARVYAEAHTGRIFGQRTFRMKLNEWPSEGFIRLPIEPVASVTTVKYADSVDAPITVSATLYRTWLEHSPPLVRFTSAFGYPTLSLDDPSPVIVDYVGGEVAIPETLEQAIWLIVEYNRLNPGGEPSLGWLSRGIPAGAIRLLDTLWTGSLGG